MKQGGSNHRHRIGPPVSRDAASKWRKPALGLVPSWGLALLAIAASQSVASAEEAGSAMRVAQEDSETSSERVGSDAAGKTQFVLEEVRRVIEANGANKVVSLSIDPDYRGGEDMYLINVVLSAHERSFSVGVLLRCRPVPGGWKSDLAFID